jgi:hypothetical protein
MPTLAEFDAARKAARGQPGIGVPTAVADAAALRDPGQGDYFRKHPYQESKSSTPETAALAELFGTAGKAAKGFLKAPLNAVKSLPSLPRQVLEGYAGLADVVKDPSLLAQLPRASLVGLQAIGNDPEMGGELLGQLALGKLGPKMPGMAEGAINATGRGVGKLGRSIEAAGTIAKEAKFGGVGVPGLGALEAVFGSHPVAGVATALAPTAAEYGGRFLQKGGKALEGVKLAAAKLAKGDTAWANDASAQRFTGPLRGPLSESTVPWGYLKPVESTMESISPVRPSTANYSAQSLLENPASERFSAKEFAANKPLADEVFGTNKDLLGRPRPSLDALKQRWGYQEPVEPPAFSFEGESTGRPGEYPPGPAAPGFNVGEPALDLSTTDFETPGTSINSPLVQAAEAEAKRRQFHAKFIEDLRKSAGQ